MELTSLEEVQFVLVVAACVILNQNDYPQKINDSKKLSKSLRKKIFAELQQKSQFGIGIVDEKKIDEINILQATKLAMFLAYQNLCYKYHIQPQIILVDGNFTPFAKQDKVFEIIAVVKGDQKAFQLPLLQLSPKKLATK